MASKPLKQRFRLPGVRRMFVRLLMLIGILGWSLLAAGREPARAQGPSESPEKAVADVSYAAKDWQKAEQLYERITAAEPANGRAWYRLGISRQGLGHHEQALQAFDKALENAAPTFLTEYQIALSYASLSNKEKTFDYLQRAAQHGFSDPDQLNSSSELVALRGDPRFAKILEGVARNQKPCAHAPESRQFDFWVGEWNVVATEGGQSVGTSRIERILNDCVILENWSSTGLPYQGKSYNTYNTRLKRWEQFWADNSQGMVHFYGELKGAVMDYYTDEVPQPDGTKLKRHLELIPLGPDKVRQVSHGSADGGKTWQPEYDFTYNRTK